MSGNLANEGTDNEGVECFTALDVIEIDPRSLLEVEDPKHRYGKNLRHYYREWENSEGFDRKFYGNNKLFFAWLDSSDSPDVSVHNKKILCILSEQLAFITYFKKLSYCSRKLLEADTVLYLYTPEERIKYILEIKKMVYFINVIIMIIVVMRRV